MLRRKKNGGNWSPYGHEPARRELLTMRRTQIIIAAVAVAVLYALFLQLTLTTETDTGQGQTTVRDEENEPVRVSVNPGGRPAFMDPRIEAPDGTGAPQPKYEEQSKLLGTVRPFLGLLAPLAAAFFLLGRVGTSARGKLAELNFGVYKGAMPYELHTARAYKQVFTHRLVEHHVFGRDREDFVFGTYLTPPSPEIRRLLGEPMEGRAGVTRLARGGKPPTPARPVKRARSPAGLLQAARQSTSRAGQATIARTARVRNDWATRQRIRRLRRARSRDTANRA